MSYTLAKKESKNCNKFIVKIVADSNDGDYITREDSFAPKEFDEFVINELLHLKQYSESGQLKDFKNNGISEYLSIPYNGWDGYCHSLENVEVTFIDKDGQIFDVNY